MATANPPSGLMDTSSNDNLSKLKEKLFGSNKPQRSIDYRIGQLTDQERLTFENALQFSMFLQQQQYQRQGYSDRSHEDTISAINRGISPEMKQLAAEVLELFLPIPVKQKPSKRYDGSSIYDDPKFFPLRDAEA
jgi:hypothetical protein